MQTSMVHDKIPNVIRKAIPEVVAIYPFGSRAEGNSRQNSDFDLAILLPRDRQIDHKELFDLKQDITLSIDQDVDLISLNDATLVMQYLISSDGVLLFGQHAGEILRFESLVLSMYQRFNEERKKILQEIHSSGKVYAE